MKPDMLLRMYKINFNALKVNLDGITDADSLIQPKPAGNSINWVVGHILISRNNILDLLGEEAIVDKSGFSAYARGSDPGQQVDMTVLSQLMDDLIRSQNKLETASGMLTEKELNSPVSNDNNGDSKVLLVDQLLFLQFHEAYHVGQTGLLRRMTGRDCAIP